MPLECKFTGAVGGGGQRYDVCPQHAIYSPHSFQGRKWKGTRKKQERQREHRKGERNERQGEGTRNVKRCIAWEAGNGRQREEM